LGEYEDVGLCSKSSVKEISTDELNELLVKSTKVLIIDLRDKEDDEDIGFETISIPHYDISKKIKLFSGYNAVVFYCRSGSRSVSVINYLQKLYKIENLYSLVL
jgi:rhodanese-related sulfurtransferase